MKQRFSVFYALAAVFVSLTFIAGLSGCEKKKAPPPADTAVKQAAPKPDEPPLVKDDKQEEEIAQPGASEAPAYDSDGKRDPFVSFIGEADISMDEESLLLPLQRYELSELKMVGVIWGGKEAKALIEDGAGIGHTVGVGELIGRSGGVVVRVNENEVTVKEEFSSVGGKTASRESTLQLMSAGGK